MSSFIEGDVDEIDLIILFFVYTTEFCFVALLWTFSLPHRRTNCAKKALLLLLLPFPGI